MQAVTEGGEGGTFLQCNRNKRSLTLDSTTAEGTEITRRLVASADIVVANMPAAGMRASGLDYETLKAVKPDIILASATAYGEGGPYSDKIGFDGAGQVMSGRSIGGPAGPTHPNSECRYADFGTALTLAIGVMMALYHRDKTGQGQHVEGALLPTALMLSNAFLIERELLQVDKPRMGNKGRFGRAVRPLSHRRRSSGSCCRSPDSPCSSAGAGWWGAKNCSTIRASPTMTSAGSTATILNDIMAEWCADKTKAELLDLLEKAKMPAAPLHSTQDVLDDPHVQAMGYLRRVPFPGASRDVPIIETPFRMSATPGTIRRSGSAVRRAHRRGARRDRL